MNEYSLTEGDEKCSVFKRFISEVGIGKVYVN